MFVYRVVHVVVVIHVTSHTEPQLKAPNFLLNVPFLVSVNANLNKDLSIHLNIQSFLQELD